jgi:CBS domain-containing protein
MTLRSILHVKGKKVFTTTPTASLELAVRAMVEHNCGSLVVCVEEDEEQMVGILTERDILRWIASTKQQLSQITVEEVMTKNVITGTSDSMIPEIMGLMTDHRIRHLPIVEDGRLVGLISIGDVVKAQHDELSAENHYLKEYIQS